MTVALNMWDLVTGNKNKIHDYVVTGFENFGSVHDQRWDYFQKIWGDNPGLGPALFDLKK